MVSTFQCPASSLILLALLGLLSLRLRGLAVMEMISA
jgi:hypothetical protein